MTVEKEDCYDCCKCFGGAVGGAIGVILIIAFALSGFALSITDIIIGATWKDCYLNNEDVHIYLIVSGAVLLTSCLLGSTASKHDDTETKKKNSLTTLGTLCSIAYFGILIWGMIIVWDTEQKDCDHGQYNYVYYRTVVICFLIVALVSLGILGAIVYGSIAGASACLE